MNPDLYTRIECEINGELIKTQEIYHGQLPGRIRAYKQLVAEHAFNKSWAIFIRVRSKMHAQKGKGLGDWNAYHRLDKLIDKIIVQKGIILNLE